MAPEDRIAAVKNEIRNHRHNCLSWHQLRDLEHLVELLEAELQPFRAFFIPASARIIAYPKGSTMAGTTFQSGSAIDLVGDVRNDKGVDVPNAVTWAADQGTLTVDPTNPEHATLVNVPDGTVNVTMTTTNGIQATHAYVLADLTPAAADFTASAA